MRYLEHVRADRVLRDRRYRPHRYYVIRGGEMVRVDRLTYPSMGAIESTVLVREHNGDPRPWKVRTRDLISG